MSDHQIDEARMQARRGLCRVTHRSISVDGRAASVELELTYGPCRESVEYLERLHTLDRAGRISRVSMQFNYDHRESMGTLSFYLMRDDLRWLDTSQHEGPRERGRRGGSSISVDGWPNYLRQAPSYADAYEYRGEYQQRPQPSDSFRDAMLRERETAFMRVNRDIGVRIVVDHAIPDGEFMLIQDCVPGDPDSHSWIDKPLEGPTARQCSVCNRVTGHFWSPDEKQGAVELVVRIIRVCATSWYQSIDWSSVRASLLELDRDEPRTTELPGEDDATVRFSLLELT